MVVLSGAVDSVEVEEEEEEEVDSTADLAVAVEAVVSVVDEEISADAEVAEAAEVVSGAAVALEATPSSEATIGLASHVEITTLHSDKHVISAVLQEEEVLAEEAAELCEAAAEDSAETDTSHIDRRARCCPAHWPCGNFIQIGCCRCNYMICALRIFLLVSDIDLL